MICANCGTENDAGRKFCGECSAKLAAVCPSCGESNSATAKFCGECATPLVAGVTPAIVAVAKPSGAAPVAELRLVSILFADLVGFTTLAEGRDAEDTRELLSKYFDISRTVIGRYGGTVEKFIGDAVMAVWGAPIAHEDDAERAVRAALDLVDAVTTLGPGIAARAGVHTGEAAVTIGATNQGMVAGDLVNTASRIQSVAIPGTVLVGEATQRSASRAVAFEAAGEQMLKGKTAPVPVWRALRVIAEVGGRNRQETLEAPFVGRADELRLLKELFHATIREQRSRLVSVIGPAGIGKTRLSREFGNYLDGIVETVLFHDGRSPAYGDGISFWALGEMVRRRAGLLENDDETTTRIKIADTVAEFVSDEAERRWIEPALLALLGIDASVTAADQLFAAWRTFFERLAESAPVVMIFEDFHNADFGLIDFVDHLLETSRTFPIYVVTLARPDLMERRPEWGAGKRSFTSVFLEPLPEPVMRELLAGLVPGLPESAVAAIVARADGMPLYAVETVRMLLAEGRLSLEDGVYRPTGDLTTLAVPETLTALIASRLDALPSDERSLVADGAVLGISFTLPALAAVGELDDAPTTTRAADWWADLETRLRSLVRREIFTLESDPRSPERGQYVFVQALIREVAYNGLAKKDRKSRHLAAAHFFGTLGTEEIAGALAGHFLAAHRNSAPGAEADAVAAQARAALSAAAHRASALGAHEQALTFLEQALAITTGAAARADLLEHAGDVATLAGRYEAADSHLRDAVSLRRGLDDRVALAMTTAALGFALAQAYRARDALDVLEPAVTEFAELAGEPVGMVLGRRLASAYFLDGQPRRAIEVADRVLEAAEHADLGEVVADTLVTRGSSLDQLGRSIEGLGAIAAGRGLAESLGLDRIALRAINNMAYLEAFRNPRSALETARAGILLARRQGHRGVLSGLIANLGELGLRTGDWDPAVAALTEALAEEWDPVDRLYLVVYATVIWAARGEPVADRLEEIAKLSSDSSDMQLHANAAVAVAFAAFTAGDLNAARSAWRVATEVLRAAGYNAARAALWAGDGPGAREDLDALDASGIHGPAIEASRRTIRAGLAAMEGRSVDALALYRDVLRSWRDLGLVWDEALCGLDMVLLLDPTHPEVGAAADYARETFARLGATPFLAKLDAALSR